ncbi:DUF1015 domain-containing protein [Belliella kenyensis]|uniref:DUF1015 domain-containing protein n=1 Tax=Belliella kenyensis TaxID=1472724 RepID=A0ABV8EGS3_9BACT|nr:DUF1015 domain-containing protein [Belliella kenyensis]MCH7400967.1 DUF1015 domain-containing protein [Belliella kenyensis]MDN3603965.1 DUF1015 domain-containing protein [Belliella kenyensis]
MAEILPIKAFRYHEKYKYLMEELTSPLFDVVSTKQREALYANPINSIHLSVPQGPKPAQRAKQLMDKWKREEVLVQDHEPGIYVYYQYFRMPGQEGETCRKGFITQIKAYDWEEGVVLRHENTIAKSVNDRVELLRHTKFQSSATHGLYEDDAHTLESYMDQAITNPLYDIEDYQGVREVLGVIRDKETISKFVKLLSEKQVILADGHHRYEGAIAFRKEMMASNPSHTGAEAYNFHMMYLTNASDKNLKILPTHRVFTGIDLSSKELLEKIKAYFIIRQLNDVDEIEELILHKKWAFGLMLGDEAYKIRLKPECIHELPSSIPEVLHDVDLIVLHFFLIEKVLGIPMAEQRYSDEINYERNLRKCLAKVVSKEASFAIITKDIAMRQVLEVCKSGHTMPQKSTYFYPKTLSGLLFASIEEEEFKFSYDLFKR